MSDISQPSAPPPSSPPSPPPQAEVPVDQSPVQQPTPLGEQAPPKPPGQEDNKSSHVSRREALQQAFARSKQAQEDAAKEVPKRAKPATDRPGMGHNQPPEPMEKAQEAKPQPDKPTAAQAAERYREAGKFARDPAKAVESQLPNADNSRQSLPDGQTQPPKPLDKNAPYREPPGRFTDNAKTEWHSTPEVVRGAVHQMAREFHGAYEKLRGDHEVMEELRPYHDLATKQGTSLRRAFDNYYGMETKLRGDLIGGLDTIVQNMRLVDPNSGKPITLQDVAHHVVNMTPEQHQLTAQRNQQTSAEMQIGQLYQTVAQQSQILNQMVYQQRFAGTRAQVDQFAEQHPRFDELSDLIKSELDLGFPLEVAYQRADRLRPSTQAAQTRTHSAQTRKTSISGAPDGGNSATTRPSDGRQRTNGEAKHPTRREAIAKAMRRVGNGV